MISLNENPEALLTAHDGDTFQLDGHTLVLEDGLDGVFLTVTSGIDNIELLPCPEGPYEWAHVRAAAGNHAVMPPQTLTDLIRNKQYTIK